MAELADAQASGACGSNIVRVQVPFPARPGIIADAVILFCCLASRDVVGSNFQTCSENSKKCEKSIDIWKGI